jgi:DNA polymerase-4
MVILHCDCDSFYASVEETLHPEYQDVPMAVAGDPQNRHGIILAKNALAKACGVKTAETIREATRKCPGLALAPPRHHIYREFCERINAIYTQYTDQVERFSVDESWLDVTGSLRLFGGDSARLADEIRERVHHETDVTISVGISWNKIFAKMGSDMNKPNGICIITRENYKDVIWPLPVHEMFGVGRRTAEALKQSGIQTIGDLAAADEAAITRAFGKIGAQLRRFARGEDDSPVTRVGEAPPPKSIGNGITFKRDLKTEHDIRTGIIALSDTVAQRLRKSGLKCATVQVTIKDTDLKSIQRQKPPTRPTQLAEELTETAMEIITASWPTGKPIRMLTVTAQNLIPEAEATEQLSFLGAASATKTEKAEKIEKTMDEIRGKYGAHSIQPAAILQNDLGIDDSDDSDGD